ncbi:hypothetical protein VNO78_26727 [Psophocarpus tetragonolobus]|uniref:Uncharacterized protein n=1 Tax=Psophocarpus tetragonolobus TaxID=3891 RepID=A0AAN9X9A4_PSOTE
MAKSTLQDHSRVIAPYPISEDELELQPLDSRFAASRPLERSISCVPFPQPTLHRHVSRATPTTPSSKASCGQLAATSLKKNKGKTQIYRRDLRSPKKN